MHDDDAFEAYLALELKKALLECRSFCKRALHIKVPRLEKLA